MIKSLDVTLWQRKVGTLVATKKGYDSRIYFYFDPEFVNSGLDIAPLRASISSIAAQSGLPIYPEEEKIFGGLPSFIADSMPDHWGNIIFNEWAKAHNIKQKAITALDRLAYIGRRGMGALEYIPPMSEALESPFKVEIAQLAELAQMAMNEAKSFHTKLSSTLAIESLFKVGTSAGGRRPKAVINLNNETGECFSGQVATSMPGFTPMIIKFDEHSDIPSTRIEYSYYLMAIDAGIKMMPSRLLYNNNETHFLTERFDRRGVEKIHTQTLAAMKPTASTYEELFETAQSLKVLPEEIQQLFRQMILNVLAANIDDHSKNFSFVMDKNGKWHIAPAYDITFTIDPSAPAYINRHSMTVNGKNRAIHRDDLLTIAKRFDIKNADSDIDNIVAIAANYLRYANEASVPDTWIKIITSEIAGQSAGLDS